jgi:hypothetical protein
LKKENERTGNRNPYVRSRVNRRSLNSHANPRMLSEEKVTGSMPRGEAKKRVPQGGTELGVPPRIEAERETCVVEACF